MISETPALEYFPREWRLLASSAVTAATRLGLRDGVVVPFRSTAAGFAHVLVVEGESDQVPRSTDPDLHAVALIPELGNKACTPASLRFLSLDRTSATCRLTAYEVMYCTHATRIRALANKELPDWPAGITSTSPTDFASLFFNISLEHDPANSDGLCQSAFVEALVDRLSVNLGQGMGSLQVEDPASAFSRYFDDVFARRRGLAEIEKFAISVRVVSSVTMLLRNAIERSDSELLIALTAQMYRVDSSNRRIEAATRAASKADAQRERRWAKFAAASLFPLLFLGFLGANVLPRRLWGQDTQGEVPVIVALAMTLVASALGYWWASSTRRGDDGH